MNNMNKQQNTTAIKPYAALLLLFFLFSYMLPLGVRNLIPPDETRYAEIPREMIADGDWIAPHLNGLRYFEKPVLGYWVHAVSILLLGENNFAVRLPSALSVGLSALLIYVLFCLKGSNGANDWRLQGILAALTYLTCIGVFGVGTTALLDSLFSFFLTAVIIAFYFAAEAPPRSTREKIFLLLSGVLCGIAFLTKGFLAFAIPVLVFAPYLIWQRRYLDLFRMLWLPVLTALLVALPWCISIHLKEPDFWRFFFWNEHIRRFIGNNAQHKESFLYFLLTAPGMFLPWTFMVPAAVSGIRGLIKENGYQGRLIRFSICWLVLPFLFFSVSKGKLVTYILPCFPPFAILMTFGLSHAFRRGRKKAFQWGAAVTGILFGLILLAFFYFQFFDHNGSQLYSRHWKAVMAADSLIFLLLFCFLAIRNHEGTKKIVLFALSPFLLFLAAHLIIPDPVIETKAPGLLLERYKHGIDNNTLIISDEDAITAVCWYLNRSDVYLVGRSGELDYGLGYKDASYRLIDIKSAADLINKNQGNILLVGRAKNISQWQNQLPEPLFQDRSGPEGYVLWRY